MKKKLISLFLAICMMISLMPMTVFADAAVDRVEYDNFQPGVNQYMVELISSYDGDYDDSNPMGEIEIIFAPNANVSSSLYFNDTSGHRSKYIIDQRDYANESLADAGFFMFAIFPKAGHRIKGLYYVGALFGTVYETPAQNEIDGQYPISDLYQYMTTDDGIVGFMGLIPELGYESGGKTKVVVSFEAADPSDITTQPTNLKWEVSGETTKAVWDAVPNAEKYKVTLYQEVLDLNSGSRVFGFVESIYVETNECDLTSLLEDEVSDGAKVKFDVCAIKNRVCSETAESGTMLNHDHNFAGMGITLDDNYHYVQCASQDCTARKISAHTPSGDTCSVCGKALNTIFNFDIEIVAPALNETPASICTTSFGSQNGAGATSAPKWYKQARADYTGHTLDGWTEMGADETFTTGYYYRVDVDKEKTGSVSYFISEDTAYSVNRSTSIAEIYNLENVIRLSGYFNTLDTPVTPPVTPPVTTPSVTSTEPTTEPVDPPYITDDETSLDGDDMSETLTEDKDTLDSTNENKPENNPNTGITISCAAAGLAGAAVFASVKRNKRK